MLQLPDIRLEITGKKKPKQVMSYNSRKAEIYRTNIADENQARQLKERLLSFFPTMRICFDLEDCDNILKIESSNDLEKVQIEAHAKTIGIHIQPLED